MALVDAGLLGHCPLVLGQRIHFSINATTAGHINCVMSGDSHLHCVDDDSGGGGSKVCECRRGYVISTDGACTVGKPGHIKVHMNKLLATT